MTHFVTLTLYGLPILPFHLLERPKIYINKYILHYKNWRLGHPTQLLGHLFLFLTWCFGNKGLFFKRPLAFNLDSLAVQTGMGHEKDRRKRLWSSHEDCAKFEGGPWKQRGKIINFQNSFLRTKKKFRAREIK
jgi:hypothetical protein